MEKTKIEVFTSPTCPYCPSALKLAKDFEKENEDVFVNELNIALPEGRRKAQQFEIYSVPTIFIKGPKHDEILAIRGNPSRERLRELIEISQGKKEIKEGKSFLQKIKEKWQN